MGGLTPAQFEELMVRRLPLAAGLGVVVEAMGEGRARVRLPFRPDLVRPGGTLVGPALMVAADVAMYAAVLSRAGDAELALTVTLTINFLRRPPLSDVIAEAEILKLGRRLAFGQVALSADGEEEPVAHATCTYALPRSGGS